MRISLSDASRLIRHDGLIMTNQVRQALKPWRELLIPLIAIPLLLAFARNALDAMPPEAALYLCLFIAFSLGFSAARLIGRRLEFLRTDSVVAPEALRARAARRYALLCASASVASVAALIALLQSRALLLGCAAILGGMAIGGVLQLGVSVAIVPHGQLARLRAGSWLRRPIAGLVFACAFTLIVLMIALRVTGSDRIIVMAIAAFLLSLPLTHVDIASVRFMASSGLSCWRSIRHHLRGPILFMGIAVPIAFLAAGFPASGLVAGIASALLLMIAMRVLAYRIFERRIADVIVSVLQALLLMIGFSVPLALPLALPAVLWWLARRARHATWLIA